MKVYYHNLLVSVSKWLLKNHSSRIYMYFMVICMLQKAIMRVPLCITNKLGQDHQLTTVKTLYFGQQILQAEAQQICITNFLHFFFFFLLKILIKDFIPRQMQCFPLPFFVR